MENCSLTNENSIETANAGEESLRPTTSLKLCLVILGVISLIYVILVVSNWRESYIDFGDGNYLYISSRIADGLVLYKDIMAPQPPCHLFSGSCLIRLGRFLGNELAPIRAFSLLVRLFTMLFVVLAARKMFRDAVAAFFAGLVYLLLPVGFWWSQGFQSEGLLILFMTSSFYCFLDQKPRALVIAALLGTLAAFTNMTAVPYLFLANLFLLVRRPRLMLYYTLPMAVFALAGIGIMELYSSGHYLENVFLNQVGTFPKKEISGESLMSYIVRKVANEGKDILTWEGGYVLLSLAGLAVYLCRGEIKDHVREYIGWHSFFLLCSILYVSKGGTMEYIFTLGEPVVALFCGYMIREFWSGPLKRGAVFKRRHFSNTGIFAAVCALVFLLIAVMYQGFFFMRHTLAELNYELPENRVHEVRAVIDAQSDPGDALLTPPFYAFMTGRRVIEEYSENYIWTIKFANEVYVDRQPGAGVEKALRIANALRERKIPLVLLDEAQTGRLPPIREAIDTYYTPLKVWQGSHLLQTLNTQIGFYIPR